MIQILLCDDNLDFLELLRKNIRDHLKCKKIHSSIYTFHLPREVPEKLITSCNIFFLDMDFSPTSETGLQFAQRIRQVNSKATIIFLTNYIEYAPAGYKVQAFRYLLKSDLEDALEESLFAAISHLELKNETISLPVSGESTALKLEDILFIEAHSHTVTVYSQNREEPTIRNYKVNVSISSLEQRLSHRGFLRIQKSYLVNMRRIERLKYDFVMLDNGTELPMSEKGYMEKKRAFLLWKEAEIDG